MKYICKKKFSAYLYRTNEIVDVMQGIIFDILDEYNVNVHGKMYLAKLRSGMTFLIQEDRLNECCEIYEDSQDEKYKLNKTMYVIKYMKNRIDETTEELNVFKNCLDDLESVLKERKDGISNE